METLAMHLEANGHRDSAEGSLLMKMDIEGSEWDVFRTADPNHLRKFRQIVIELHWPYEDSLMPADCLKTRESVIRKLLDDFHIVHIKPEGTPGWNGQFCLVVTFAN